MNEKIDFVIPWVDGTDLEWKKERFMNLGRGEENEYIENQYRDWDLLKFWFRGVENFAPWVNKIYFVTWGHIPDFLNVEHPKLVVVNHEDYIPKKYLPTFSSHTIENNFHRIEGLEDRFVCFNDDVFITKPTTPDDFFHRNSPKTTAIIKPVTPARYDTISNLMVNNIGVINKNFKKREVIKRHPSKWFNIKYGFLNLLNLNAIPWGMFLGFYEQHTANSYLKSTFTEVWEKEAKVLDLTCENRTRNFKVDVNQWLFKNWQIAKGEFYPRTYKFSKYLMVDSVTMAKTANKNIKDQSFSIICINDHYEGDNFDEVIQIIQEGFLAVFPDKSSYEI